MLLKIEAIIDTGAVMTCVPQKVLNKINTDNLEYGKKNVRGAIGEATQLTTYFVNLKLAKCRFPDIEVIAINSDYAIIGRDIINSYRIVLDAPNGEWEVDAEC